MHGNQKECICELAANEMSRKSYHANKSTKQQIK